MTTLFLAAVVFALRAVYEGIFIFVDRPSAIVDDVLFWWQIAGFIALPIALVAGMLRARLARESRRVRASRRAPAPQAPA